MLIAATREATREAAAWETALSIATTSEMEASRESALETTTWETTSIRTSKIEMEILEGIGTCSLGLLIHIFTTIILLTGF